VTNSVQDIRPTNNGLTRKQHCQLASISHLKKQNKWQVSIDEIASIHLYTRNVNKLQTLKIPHTMLKYLKTRGVRLTPNMIDAVFFKKNVRYPVWTCRDPISLILGT